MIGEVSYAPEVQPVPSRTITPSVQLTDAGTPTRRVRVLRVRFPHKWFRLAVVLSLALIAFQFAIDDATSRSICCSYRAFQIIAEAMDRFPLLWELTLGLVLALAVVTPVVAVFSVLSFVARSHVMQFATDLVFTLGVPAALFLIWTTAVGHAEVAWAFGFRIGFIIVSVLWTSTFLATRRQGANWKLRSVLYCVGAFIVAVAPVVMVSLHSSEVIYGGDIIYEDHAGSVRYGFATLFSSLFWLADVLLSFRRDGSLGRPPSSQ